MKFADLKSVGHNIADSLGSGMGLMIGYGQLDIFGEAAATPEGFICVDFLAGSSTGGAASPSLTKAITLYRDALPGLCERQNVELETIDEMTARYEADALYQVRFTVTVADRSGRRSVDRYVGWPGKRDHKRADLT